MYKNICLLDHVTTENAESSNSEVLATKGSVTHLFNHHCSILIVAVLHQVERMCFLVSPGSSWWKSFLLWMKVVLCFCCLAFPSFWIYLHALGSVQKADWRYEVKSWQKGECTANLKLHLLRQDLTTSVQFPKAPLLIQGGREETFTFMWSNSKSIKQNYC